MKNFLCLFIITTLFLSCSNDVKTNNPAFQATHLNKTWRGSDVTVSQNVTGGLIITAYSGYDTMILQTSSNIPGTYLLGSTNQTNYVTYSVRKLNVITDFETSIVQGPVFKLAAMVSNGTGYSNSSSALTSGGSGSGLKLNTTTNTSGGVSKVDIVARGDGYKAGDIVTIVGGGNNAKVKILNVQQSNGEIVIQKVEEGKFTGTFKFNVVNEFGEVKNFANGIFYKI